MAERLTTKLHRPWVFKTGIFMLVLVVMGLWGLYDGLYLYPKRGLEDASFQFRDYLAAADKASQLTASNLATPDPKASHAALAAKGDELKASGAATVEANKLAWLDSLKKAWRLNTDPKPLGEVASTGRELWFDMIKGEGYTTASRSGSSGADRAALSPRQLLDELTKRWSTSNKPSPLSTYDMIFQWIFVAAGAIGGPWILLTIMRSAAKARQITFEPETQRLGLPGGVSIVPSDLTDIDKTRWHKFYCTLVTAQGSHELDLLRYTPLEEWVLAMERTRFPERAAEAEARAAAEAKADADVPNPT